jgi:hypothetical protein
MICWILRKLDAWLTKPEDGPSLDEWVYAPTSISYADKASFVLKLSYVGGIVGMHHPRFKEMQADFQSFAKERTCPSSERSR